MTERDITQAPVEKKIHDLVVDIQEEEMILGLAREWTPFQKERLERIRNLRSKLPKNTTLRAREYLGELFHLSKEEEGQKDFDLQSQEERV